MASSFVSNDIFAGLKAQFENAMIEVVANIAEGENLDKDELMAKYLVNVISVSKETKGKAPRKASVTVKPVEDNDTKCECMTAKGKPCSMKPLDGTKMCRVHTKKAETPKTEPEPKPKKTSKKTKAKKREEPMHTHELDDDMHEDCELCQTHGCPLAVDDDEEEYETVSSPPKTLRERLSRAAMAEDYLDDEDDD
jgi:hypothetical protein